MKYKEAVRPGSRYIRSVVGCYIGELLIYSVPWVVLETVLPGFIYGAVTVSVLLTCAYFVRYAPPAIDTAIFLRRLSRDCAEDAELLRRQRETGMKIGSGIIGDDFIVTSSTVIRCRDIRRFFLGRVSPTILPYLVTNDNEVNRPDELELNRLTTLNMIIVTKGQNTSLPFLEQRNSIQLDEDDLKDGTYERLIAELHRVAPPDAVFSKYDEVKPGRERA